MRYVVKTLPSGGAVGPVTIDHYTECFSALILEEGLTQNDFKMLFKSGKGNMYF